MRLDLFLKWSRIVLRRTLAKAMCDAGRVSINGTEARAAHEVRVGDTIASAIAPPARDVPRSFNIRRTPPARRAAAKCWSFLKTEETVQTRNNSLALTPLELDIMKAVWRR